MFHKSRNTITPTALLYTPYDYFFIILHKNTSNSTRETRGYHAFSMPVLVLNCLCLQPSTMSLAVTIIFILLENVTWSCFNLLGLSFDCMTASFTFICLSLPQLLFVVLRECCNSKNACCLIYPFHVITLQNWFWESFCELQYSTYSFSISKIQDCAQLHSAIHIPASVN